jgi:hypothetical protein
VSKIAILFNGLKKNKNITLNENPLEIIFIAVAEGFSWTRFLEADFNVVLLKWW